RGKAGLGDVDEGMAHVLHVGAGLPVHLRLKRQDSADFGGVPRDGLGPALAPSPSRRAEIVDHRDPLGLRDLRQAHVKLGKVNQDQGVRPLLFELLREAREHPAQDLHAADHFDKADGADRSRIVKELDTGLSHQRPAHPKELQIRLALFEFHGEVRAVQIARGFTCHHHDFQCRAPSIPGTYDTKLIPWRSASSMHCSRSSTNVTCASKARTAPFPRMTVSTVSGPITGTSKRGSCWGLATLTTTPPPLPSSRPRAIVRSVPSTASTANTAPSLTTAVW